MKNIIIILTLLMTTLTFGSYAEKKITCDIFDHPQFSQTIIYGDSEIHFVRKNGSESSFYYDGYLLNESQKEISAIYHDGDDLLFFLDITNLEKIREQGVIVATVEEEADDSYLYPESEYYIIGNCTLEEFKGW